MPSAQKRRPANYRPPRDAEPPPLRRAEIPAGKATLGVRRDAIFAWDNEMDENAVDVAAFECDAYPITNAQWLEFVGDGGPVPSFWIARDDGTFGLLGAWEELPFLRAAPVWVTNEQARAYAQWRGRRLMTEAEYHRAAFGTPSGDERAYPWGSAAPEAHHGNFDWQSWDVAAAGTFPAGASAWGIHELIGNGWEHTATPFAPFPNFRPHATYDLYSKEFFDGKHYVVKGASPITPLAHIRRSFRNWFYGDYPYFYAKFRTVRS